MFTNRRVPLRSAGGLAPCGARGARSAAPRAGDALRFARAAGRSWSCWRCAAPALAQEPADLVEGRRLFDALEYDQALPFLDRAISALEPQASRDPASRTALISAFEMRARARFGIGNREGAVADFRALLGLEPGFALPEGISPRVVAILDEVRVATIGSVELTLDPLDAQLVVDGVPRPVGNGRLAVAAGAHTLRVSRIGYRPIDQPVTVLAGQNLPLRVALERTASVVTMVTTPPGAEVFVNGVSKGRTDPTVAASATAAAAAQLQVPVAQLAALVLTDLTTGTFDVEFRRDCYVTERRRISIGELGDLGMEPVTLKPSVGALVLESEPAGATVLIDGDARGEAPATIDGVCAGTHVIEFRSSVGRSVERVSLEPGASLTIKGRVRPGFALLSDDPGGAADPRVAVERAFVAADTIVLYAPAADVLKEVIAQSGATADWFGVGAVDAKPPIDLRERLRRLAEGLGAQGLAWVQLVRPGGNEVRLALLTPGSTEPDEITVTLDSPDSVKQALDRLQTPLVLTRGVAGGDGDRHPRRQGRHRDGGRSRPGRCRGRPDPWRPGPATGWPARGVGARLRVQARVSPARSTGEPGRPHPDRPVAVVASRPSARADAGHVERPVPASQRDRGGPAGPDGDHDRPRAPAHRPAEPGRGAPARR